VPRERCDECGFDSDEWSDEAAVEAIRQLPVLWADAVDGLGTADARRRVQADTWSIAEYTDHVREVLFIMRFVLDRAIEGPGVDLGPPLDPPFSPDAREIDLDDVVAGMSTEASALCDRLGELSDAEWSVTATVGGDALDAHWVCRHAVHDAYHHLGDIHRLRALV
jgi:DinB superfamily